MRHPCVRTVAAVFCFGTVHTEHSSRDKDGKMTSKDCIFHQPSDCGVGSGIASPEIVSDVLLCENFEDREKHIEGTRG